MRLSRPTKGLEAVEGEEEDVVEGDEVEEGRLLVEEWQEGGRALVAEVLRLKEGLGLGPGVGLGVGEEEGGEPGVEEVQQD